MAGLDPAKVRAEAATLAFYPNRYMHESWREGMLPAPLWDLLGGCPRTEGRFAAFVIDRAGLSPVSSLAVDGPRARFCLLPSQGLAKISLHLGLVLNASRFGKVIDGKVVARIKRDLGAPAYEFALRRAPLLTTQTDPLAPDLSAETPLGEQLERSGVNYLGLALLGLAPDLLARFKLKLPKVQAAVLEAPHGDVSPEAAWQLVRKVAREVEPEWSALLE